MNRDTLIKAMGNQHISDEEVDAFNAAMLQADINTVKRAAMWCAQLGHESAGLKHYEELASGIAYEGRVRGLGNTQTGDGVRFKGRGPIQVTGRHNYTVLSQWAHEKGYVPTRTYFVDNPRELATVRYGFLGAVWYWTTQRPLNLLSDAGDIDGATRAINGGTNGLDDRKARYQRCLGMGAALLPTQPKKEEVAMSVEAKDIQVQLRGPDLRGWVTRLYDKLDSDQRRLTLVDFVRELHTKVLSELPVGDSSNARPRPLTEPDDLLGHVLSLRAQVEELSKKVDGFK